MTIKLIPLSEAHLPHTDRLIEDDAVKRFTRVPSEPPAGWVEQWLGTYETGRADGTRELFAIVDDGAFVGIAAAPNIRREARTIELGYVVAPGARGRGVASEALRQLTEWALEQGMHRLELLISVDNVGSKKVAERCGYRYEGTLREAYFKDGVHEDTELWARLSTD